MHRTALVLVLLAAALPAPAAAYPWPFRPFDRPHPIRGFFGDPRTVFADAVAENGIEGPGAFSFHQGVDISAPDGTPIYSVSDGVANYAGATVLDVDSAHGVTFRYFHILPVVGQGERVWTSRTILGYVQAPFAHVHLTEIDGGRAVNPLLPGHLAPYPDTTEPAVEAVEFRNALGPGGEPSPLCGRVEIDAQASDQPSLPVPGLFHDFPVAPALVAWSIAPADRPAHARWHVAADFRRRLPPNRTFWDVYARGTYENLPRFGYVQYDSPGRYLFRLAASFDTRGLRNGSYVLSVRAADVRGRATVFRQPFSVLNSPAACPGSLPAEPPLGVPPAPAPAVGKPAPPGGGGTEEPPPGPATASR